MNKMTELDISLIQGIMFGLEAIDASVFEGEIQWGIVLDVGFFRFTLIRWNEAI